MIQQYYLRFVPTAKVDYTLILNLYDLADYNTETNCFDTVRYRSLAELAQQLGTTEKTLCRHLNKEDYKNFLSIDKKTREIRLIVDFKKTGYKVPFITLSPVEVRVLREKNEDLLYRYFIYLKYYCGYSANKRIDTTEKQILSAIGYSSNSSYIQKLSAYNTELSQKGIINIKKYRDEKGKIRNIYSF